LEAVPGTAHPGSTAVLPVDYWRNENNFLEANSAKRAFQFVSPDGSTFFPAGEDFVTGALYYGTKLNDALRAFGLAPNVAGRPFYVSDESEEKTYVGSVGVDGAITNLKLFAKRGGESVAVDERGNVYVAAGQVFVYNPSGELIDTLEIPERPSQLLFGGSDGRTLFVLARSSLYAVYTGN